MADSIPKLSAELEEAAIPGQVHNVPVVKVLSKPRKKPTRNQRGPSVSTAKSYMARPYHDILVAPYENAGIKIFHDTDGFGIFVWPSPTMGFEDSGDKEELSVAITRIFMVDFSPCCDDNCYMEGDGTRTYFVCAKCGKEVEPIRKMVRRPSYGKGAKGRRTMNWPWVRIPWKDVPAFIEAVQKVYNHPAAPMVREEMRVREADAVADKKAVETEMKDDELWGYA